MSSIVVNTSVLDGKARDFDDIARKLQKIADQLAESQRNLSWNVAVKETIRRELDKHVQNVRTYSSRAKTFSSSLNTISGYYKRTEKQIAGSGVGAAGISVKNGYGGTSIPGFMALNASKAVYTAANKNKSAKWISELFEKFVGADAIIKYAGKAGIVGGLVSIPFSVFRGYEKWKSGEKTAAESIVGFAKNGKDVVNNIYKMYTNYDKLSKLTHFGPAGTAQAWKTGLKRAFGLESISNLFTTGRVSTAGTFSQRFYNNFHNQEGFFEQFTHKGVKGALKWTGVALTAVTRGIQNYGEHKEGKISTKRAVAETVTETAIEVGKDWLIATAVTAGIAAVTGAAAPVVAVGVGVVAVSAGLDYVCNKLTGKDLTEAASDLVLDTAQKIGEGAKKVAGKIGSAVKGWFKK